MLDLKGKSVLIAGLGLSGKAVLYALSSIEMDISVYDDRDIEWEDSRLFDKLQLSNVDTYINGAQVPDKKFDYVIMSPGIPLDVYFVENAKRQGAKIIGELELAFEMGKGKYIAITGTNGKTTTTTLVGQIFKSFNKKTTVCGNIGVPVISTIDDADDESIIVTEVSSFQLESILEFKPHVSAILNITEDHMDRHKTMKNYGDVKARVFMNQDEHDFLIYNADDDIVCELVLNSKANLIPFSRLKELEVGIFVKDNKIIIKNSTGQLIELIDVDELMIPGVHNLENALAATAMTYFGGVDPHLIAEGLRRFGGVEHRLELIRSRNGVSFVNDSKGTNPDASIKAIDAIGGGIFLIAGGYDKGSDFHDFINSFDGRVKHLLLIGETAQHIKETAEELGFKNIDVCESMNDAVRIGSVFAEDGDTVLLSPASASWDMYKNFEERGNHFRKLVGELE